MKIQLIKHTGEFETVKVDGEEVEREILEVVRETEADEDTKDSILRSERRMAESRTQDSGIRHSARVDNQ